MPLFGKNQRNDHTKTAYKPQVWQVKSKHFQSNKNHKKQQIMTERSADQPLQIKEQNQEPVDDQNKEDFSWIKRTATVLT